MRLINLLIGFSLFLAISAFAISLHQVIYYGVWFNIADYHHENLIIGFAFMSVHTLIMALIVYGLHTGLIKK
jgi:uncharacterized membrane protein YqhA